MEEEKEQARNDATVDISMSNVMTLGVPASSASTAGRRSERADMASKADTSRPSNGIGPEGGRDDGDGDGSDLNSEVEEQERLLDRKGKGKAKGGVRAFAQRDIVAQAFAGDNVVQVSVPLSVYLFDRDLLTSCLHLGIRGGETS